MNEIRILSATGILSSGFREETQHRLRERGGLTMKLWQVTKLIRSKNSGPFELTFDVIVECVVTHRAARGSPVNEQRETKVSLRYLPSFDSLPVAPVPIHRRVR
jgi:hypothetical protein